MGTKQPRSPLIDSLDRSFARYRRPDQMVNILNRLDVGSDDTHLSSKLTDGRRARAKSLETKALYNTVILAEQVSRLVQLQRGMHPIPELAGRVSATIKQMPGYGDAL
jgi:hypothetical protein